MPTLRHTRLFLLVCLSLALACDVREEQPVPNEKDLLNEALELYEEGAYGKSEERFAEVMPMLRNGSKLRELALSYSTRAHMRYRSGRFREAFAQIDSAILTSRAARDYRREAASWFVKGDFLTNLAAFDQARESYDKALSLFSAFNDRRNRAKTLLRKGRTDLLEGRLEDALGRFQQALSISLEDGDKRESAEGLAGTAQVYFFQRKFEESASTFAQAHEAASGSDSLQAWIQLGAARSLRALGDQAGALNAISLGERESRTSENTSLTVLFLLERGLIAKEGNRLQDALAAIDEALEQARESGDQVALHYLALFRIQITEQGLAASGRVGSYAPLIDQYSDIADAFALIDNRTGEAYARIRKAQILRGLNRLDEAEGEYVQALAVEDSRLGEYVDPDKHLLFLQELGLGPVREQWYRDFATLCVQRNNLDAAVKVLERARLKRQWTVLRHNPPRLQVPGIQEAVDSLTALLNHMTDLQREISGMSAVRPLLVLPQLIGDLKKELKDLHASALVRSADVAERMPNFAPVVYLGAVPSQDLQSLIPQGTAIVQYLPGEEELYILIQTSRRLELRRSAICRARLAGLLAEYIALMQDPNVYAGAGGESSIEPMLRFARLSPELYSYLVKPLEPFFGDRLVIIPDGIFEGFPLHALEQQTDGEIHFLIELVGVEYSPSLTSLLYRTIERRPIRSVTGVGNPTGRDWSIDYELRDLRSFFKDAAIFTGLEATWTRLKNASPDLLILVTEFRNPAPDLSFGSMGLSDGVTSGELEFFPFERLDELRPVPALVLSNHHEGGRGLRPDHANVLRLRGTPEVYLNAWPADRKAAKFFSEFFVTHIANGLIPPEAYRQALLNLVRIREVQHPRSWGQFFFFGGL